MKKFILKISVYLAFVIVIHIATAVFFAGNKTDIYYLRLTSSKQKSLILGTSKAAVGLQPEYINKILSDSPYRLPLYNFAFTINHSPYGPAYLRAIKKKLDPETKNGLFLVTVDPWVISRKLSNKTDNSLLFEENNSHLGNLHFFNISVNFGYLVKNYPKGWGNLIIDHFLKKGIVLNADGWLAVNVPMDSLSTAARIREKIKAYTTWDSYINRTFSETRFNYLCKTIELLLTHGDVYLLRLPVIKEIKEFGDELMPNFDDLMYSISQKYNVPYFNFFNDTSHIYQTSDGNHLSIQASQEISVEIAKKIKEYKNKKKHHTNMDYSSSF